MTAKFVFEWTFTPTDYFEDVVDFECDYGSIHVEDGKAEAHVPAELCPLDDNLRCLRNQLHAELDARFLAAQVLSHKPYKLSNSSLSKLYSDGRKGVYAFVEGATIVVSGGIVDFVQKDASGNVVRDTRQERIDHRIEFAQLAARYYLKDDVANMILRSYAAAVNDPRNELIHLYEIRDALCRCFGGEGNVRSALDISRNQWSNFRKLANNEPLNQGRHRGQNFGLLRDATAKELSEAREFARNMISSYLVYLDKAWMKHNVT